MIPTEVDSAASTATVNRLLVDVDSRSTWPPHVVSILAALVARHAELVERGTV